MSIYICIARTEMKCIDYYWYPAYAYACIRRRFGVSCTILYYTILYRTVLYYAMLCYAMLPSCVCMRVLIAVNINCKLYFMDDIDGGTLEGMVLVYCILNLRRGLGLGQTIGGRFSLVFFLASRGHVARLKFLPSQCSGSPGRDSVNIDIDGDIDGAMPEMRVGCVLVFVAATAVLVVDGRFHFGAGVVH